LQRELIEEKLYWARTARRILRDYTDEVDDEEEERRRRPPARHVLRLGRSISRNNYLVGSLLRYQLPILNRRVIEAFWHTLWIGKKGY
jgi:hypothetical protein